MTKDEIKKALALCNDVYAPCNGCPYETCTNCDNTLHTDALKLITEQEREIEKLKADIGHQIDATNDAENLADHLKYDLNEQAKQAQIDVLNNVKDVLTNQKHECLERNNLVGYSAICVCEKYIDGLIKEIEDEAR